MAILDRMVGEGFGKKVILERRKRKSYVCVWGRAVQKLGMTNIIATWDRVTNVAEGKRTREDYERHNTRAVTRDGSQSLNKVGKHWSLLCGTWPDMISVLKDWRCHLLAGEVCKAEGLRDSWELLTADLLHVGCVIVSKVELLTVAS